MSELVFENTVDKASTGFSSYYTIKDLWQRLSSNVLENVYYKIWFCVYYTTSKFHQSSKNIDQELFYSCTATLNAVMTIALIFKKKRKKNVFGLRIG